MPPRRQGRRPPPTPEQIRSWKIISSSPDDPDPAFVHAADDHQLGPGIIALGVVRHPSTHYYHVVMSLYGNDATCVACTRTRDEAATFGAQFGNLYTGWDMRGSAASEALQEALHAEAERCAPLPPAAWPLPDDEVRAFLAALSESFRRAN
jgi:hypothetical protein